LPNFIFNPPYHWVTILGSGLREHFQIRLFKPGFSRFGCVYKNVLIEDHFSGGRAHWIAAKWKHCMVRKNKKSHDCFPHFRGNRLRGFIP